MQKTAKIMCVPKCLIYTIFDKILKRYDIWGKCQTKNVNATINNSIHNSNNNDYNRYSKQII